MERMETAMTSRRAGTSSLTRVAVFAALTSVLAFISIPLPFGPVPMTAQSFGTMLAGLILDPGEAASSQVLYIFLGIAGMPVFAGNSSGLGVLTGPTGGYLWGFVVGAYVIALLTRRGTHGKPPSTTSSITACVLGGVLVVYALGVLQLWTVTRLPLGKAIFAGALPFLPGDLLKACIAGSAGSRLRRAVRASQAHRTIG
ncbi:MAG: biotin transporter BioY [Firmicutes bacterium]|jgi:biotin transport system substrate-specific component|nr:biotin transporter BioY [Bacillota bacterium]MDH7495213.1 biotin transporter BioY [Bacillota bacterium]